MPASAIVSPEKLTPDRSAGSRRTWACGWICLLLALSTLGVYAPVRGYDFVAFDDADYVSDNRMVQAGLTWAGVKWAFTTGHASNWHPFTWLSHMLDAELFGPGAAGPHVVNLLLHIANTLLLFAVLRRLTGAVWRSAMVAALFALHPLHVESVAWISERKDVLSAFFFLLTVWAYARYALKKDQRPETKDQELTGGSLSLVSSLWSLVSLRSLVSSRWYAAALVLFACGLMSKPMLVTLPCVLLLLDYWPLRRVGEPVLHSLPRLVAEKIPFFALTVASCVITFVVQQRGGAVGSLSTFTVGERIANALVAYARYIGKTFWPAELAIFYPHPGNWPLPQVALAVAIVVAIGVGILWWGRRFPFVAVGWLWFLGMLIPTLGLVQVGLQSMADRYTYLPSIGLFIVVAWSVAEISLRRRVPRAALGAGAALIVAGCAVKASVQVSHWRDSESLFGHAIGVTKGNYMAHNSLGHALRDDGRIDEAIGHFQTALRYWPGFAEAHDNLGNALLQKGDVDGAIRHFRRAVEVRPNFALAHYNLGTTLLERGDMAGALAALETAAALRPGDALAELNLGNVRLQRGEPDLALAHYAKVIELEPRQADAHNNSGSALLQRGRVAEAIHRFQEALRIQPDHANAHFNLADIYLKQGRLDDGIAHLEKTVALAPQDAEARQYLESARRQKQAQRSATSPAIRHSP